MLSVADVFNRERFLILFFDRHQQTATVCMTKIKIPPRCRVLYVVLLGFCSQTAGFQPILQGIHRLIKAQNLALLCSPAIFILCLHFSTDTALFAITQISLSIYLLSQSTVIYSSVCHCTPPVSKLFSC